MVSYSAKAVLLLILVALPCVAFSQATYSDAAFRTFISVSVNGSTVWAKVTYLNITYFSKVNGSALADVYRKANASRNLQDLYQDGNYSNENFTAEVDPVNGSLLRFTFEGGNVTDSSGREICNPVKTDENGTAMCEILYFKNAAGQKQSVEQYKSCGYVAVRSDEKKLPEGRLQAASQTAVVCPEDNAGLSAFGPAIYSEIGSRLPLCFPAMLIAGLLIAAMYYSGRDPLSLFDITTPKLPKTQSFRVKMETSPQMLRQVQRRYLMIKGQARRDSLREVARMAKAMGWDRRGVKAAEKEMGRFYDDLAAMAKRGLGENDELLMRQRWTRIMEKYSRKPDGTLPDKDSERRLAQRLERSLAFSSGLLEAYIKAHQARESMNAARNKTNKGWWARNVSDKVVNSLTDASIAFETSKTGKVLGRIPLVKKVVSTPTKVLDVAAQLRGSRNALKGIRGEMLGQVATMLGKTKLGQPVYRAARAMHIGKDGKTTAFGRAYEKWTNKSFSKFEEKHDLASKRLVEFYKVADSIRQQAIDAHNRMFDELADKLIAGLPMRANAVRQAVEAMKGVSKEEREGLLRANSLSDLFERIATGIRKSKDGGKIADEISSLLGADARKFGKADLDRLLARAEAAGLSGEQLGKLRSLFDTAGRLRAEELGLLRHMEEIGGKETQAEMLRGLADKMGERSAQLEKAIAQFDEAEKTLRANLLVFLDKDIASRSLNYYRIVDRDQLKSAMSEGMTLDQLRRKYGSQVDSLFAPEAPGLFKKALDAKGDACTARTGRELQKAIEALERLAPEKSEALQAILGKWGGKETLRGIDREKIAKALDSAGAVKSLEDRIFGSFNAKERDMKGWMLRSGENDLFARYGEIASALRDMPGGCAFGRNPLGQSIASELERVLRRAGMSEKDAREIAYADGNSVPPSA